MSDSRVLVSQSVKDYFSAEVLTIKDYGKFMLHYAWEGVRHRSRIGRIGMEKRMMHLAPLTDTPELKALTHEVKARVVTS